MPGLLSYPKLMYIYSFLINVDFFFVFFFFHNNSPSFIIPKLITNLTLLQLKTLSLSLSLSIYIYIYSCLAYLFLGTHSSFYGFFFLFSFFFLFFYRNTTYYSIQFFLFSIINNYPSLIISMLIINLTLFLFYFVFGYYLR